MLIENLPCMRFTRLWAMFSPRPLPSVWREASPRTKALHKLVGGDVERVAGDVLDGDDRLFPFDGGVDIDARAGEGVFADVVEEVVEHAPEEPPVGHRARRRVGDVGYHDELPLLHAPPVLGEALFDYLARIRAHEADVHVARARLAGLDQILGELLEALALPVEDLEIFGLLLRRVRLV